MLDAVASCQPMSLEDLDWVAETEGEVHLYPWRRGHFEDSLLAGYSCWLLRVDGKRAGYAVMMVVMDEAHLLNIGVARAQQGKGYGKFLLDHVRDEALRAGAVQLFLEVRPSNEAALAMYRKRGFAEVARRKGYYPARGGREDALIMRREL